MKLLYKTNPFSSKQLQILFLICSVLHFQTYRFDMKKRFDYIFGLFNNKEFLLYGTWIFFVLLHITRLFSWSIKYYASNPKEI